MPVSHWTNRKLAGLIKGQTIHRNSALSDSRLLWCDFIGATFWPHGFWNHHRETYYLNVQMVESGTLTVRSSSGSIMVPAGSMVVIPPGEFTLEANSPGGLHKKHFGISGPLCLRNLSLLGLDKIILLPNCPDSEFLLEFEHLRKLAEDWGPADPAAIHAYTAQTAKLMMMLSQRAENRNLPQTLIIAKSFMEYAFSSDLTLEKICQHSGCSKTLLQNLFRKHFNTTPIKYLTSLRMKYAEQLLKGQNYPVKIIAEMCGYNNPLYFSNAFKKYADCYPREFRRRYGEDGLSDTISFD